MIEFLKIKGLEKYDLDDPKATIQHKEIIQEKPFLKKLYQEWYNVFVDSTKSLPLGKIIELGSGGGFLKELIPSVITSDILTLPNCDMQFSALDMPFEEASVSAIFMVDVFHHIPDSEKFLSEVQRILKPGGKMIMIEPANSAWGRFIYQNFHHEPFDPTKGWTIPDTGPMTGANGALPWIVFERDRNKFNDLFPRLSVELFQYHTPLRYLLSGGVSIKALVPECSFTFFSYLEKLLSPFARQFSMFLTIKVVKV